MRVHAQIPPQYAAELEALGIRDPLTNRVTMFVDSNLQSPLAEAEFVCTCGGRHKRCPMVPFRGDTRWILIGQCSECGEIVFSLWDAHDPIWTGPALVRPAGPMYEKGHGA